MSDISSEIDLLLIERAKEMFLSYVGLKKIKEETGLSTTLLRKYAFEDEGQRLSWRTEREQMSLQAYTDISDRNRYLIQDSTARIASLIQKSVAARERKVDQDGNFVPLDTLEMFRLMKIMFVAQKLSETLPEPLKDTPITITGNPDNNAALVLDMDKVFRAIQLDKSFQKRLGVQSKEQEDVTDRSKSSEPTAADFEGGEEFREFDSTAKDDLRRSVTREPDLEGETLSGDEETGPAPRSPGRRMGEPRAGEPVYRGDSDGVFVRPPSSVSPERMGAKASPKTPDNDQGSDSEMREGGAGDDSLEEFDDLGTGIRIDALKDEYS